MTRLLTLQHAADRLGVHWKTVYKLVRDGKLPGFKVGDGPKAHIRIEPKDLDAYLRARRIARPDSRQRTHEDECAAVGVEPDHAFR